MITKNCVRYSKTTSIEKTNYHDITKMIKSIV